MNERIIKVFYDENAYPFKEKELINRYSVVGSAFQGADNTTEFRFYTKNIGGTNRTWAVIGKLPNGKKGFKILGTPQFDSEIDQYYYSFHLTQFFTQYKGDLYLSLGGSLGEIVEQEEQEYEVTTDLIEATGTIKLSINYSVTLLDSDYEELQDWLVALSSKLDTELGIVVLASASVDVSGYEEGQIFFVPSEYSFYKNESGSLTLIYDLNAYRDRVGLIKRSGVLDSTHPLTEAQLEQAKKQFCLMLYTGVTPREMYIKVSGVNTETEDTIKFVKIDNVTYTQLDGDEWITHYKAFTINASTGEVAILEDRTITSYSKQGAMANLLTVYTDQEVESVKTFNKLPQTNENRTYTSDREITDKEYVDDNVGEVNNDLASHKANKSNPHEVTKSQVGLGNVDNVKQVPMSYLNPHNEGYTGVAALDSSGKVPVSQIPPSVLGQMEYCGSWDASSSSDQTSRTPRKGDYYICNTNGTHNPDGTDTGIDYVVGDWAIYDVEEGQAIGQWDKIDNTDAVSSVNGKTGIVVLNKNDIGLGNVDNVKQYPNASGVNLENTKIDTDSAIATFQPKTQYADLSSILPNEWVEDTSETPHVWKYTSDNIYSQVGYAGNNDVSFACGIDNATTILLGDYRYLKCEVESHSDNETYATIYLLEQPSATMNIQVGLVKQYTGGDYLGAVVTTDLLYPLLDEKQKSLYKHNITTVGVGVGRKELEIITTRSTQYTSYDDMYNDTEIVSIRVPNDGTFAELGYDSVSDSIRMLFIYIESGSLTYSFANSAFEDDPNIQTYNISKVN